MRKVLLGIGSFGSLIAIAIFLVLLVTFERISEEPLMGAKPRGHSALPENYSAPLK